MNYYRGRNTSGEPKLYKMGDVLFQNLAEIFKMQEISAAEFLVLKHKHHWPVLDLDALYKKRSIVTL